MQRTLAVMLVTVSSAIAIAQPSAVAPIAPAPEEPAPYAYPRRTVDRPLLLPEGGLDIGLPFSFRNDSTTYFNPYAYIGTPLFELHVGMDLQIGDRPDPDTSLSAIYVGGLREIIPCRIPGLAVGVQLVAIRPGGDQLGFSPNLLAYYKRALAPFLAIVPSASLGYDYAQILFEDVSGIEMEGSTHQLDGSLSLRTQLQAGSVFAIEALVSAGYFQDLGDNSDVGIGSHGEQTIGGTAYLSISPNVDLRFTYSRTFHSFEFRSDGIVLAMNIRRI